MKPFYFDLNILDETDRYVVGHSFEDAYVIDKVARRELLHDEFYGDPSCGLIDRNNEWALIAGEHITIWRKDKVTRIDKEQLRDVYAVRTVNEITVEILVDPWSTRSAIWTLDVNSFALRKIRDFEDYRELDSNVVVVW
jgi:hypothetical protein